MPQLHDCIQVLNAMESHRSKHRMRSGTEACLHPGFLKDGNFIPKIIIGTPEWPPCIEPEVMNGNLAVRVRLSPELMNLSHFEL
jgi:hypothetical protein